MAHKHCEVFPYGRIDLGKYDDSSNGGVTTLFSFLTLWENGTPDEEIEDYCKAQVDSMTAEFRELVIKRMHDFCKELYDELVSEKTIEYGIECEKRGALLKLKRKQLRIEKFENPIYTPYAGVVFKKPDLLYMASGNFVWTNGPVFKQITGGERPIRCHDRGETQEMYNFLSQ